MISDADGLDRVCWKAADQADLSVAAASADRNGSSVAFAGCGLVGFRARL